MLYFGVAELGLLGAVSAYAVTLVVMSFGEASSFKQYLSRSLGENASQLRNGWVFNRFKFSEDELNVCATCSLSEEINHKKTCRYSDLRRKQTFQ